MSRRTADQAYIHEGEKITPKQCNGATTAVEFKSEAAAKGNMTFSGGISITVQGGDTSESTLDQIVRKLLPKLNELSLRRRTA